MLQSCSEISIDLTSIHTIKCTFIKKTINHNDVDEFEEKVGLILEVI